MKLTGHKLDISSSILELSQHCEPPSSSVHHSLCMLVTENRLESLLIVTVQKVVDVRLSSELINSLHDFVTCCSSQSGEERKVFGDCSPSCGILEYTLSVHYF